MPDLPDIETEADVRAVVHAFYRDMEADPVLGGYFAGLDWEAHLLKMVAFWSSVVFQTGAYRGRPFDARIPGLNRTHFAYWVGRFLGTVDGLYAGPRAGLMKARAEQIACVPGQARPVAGPQRRMKCAAALQPLSIARFLMASWLMRLGSGCGWRLEAVAIV